MSSSCCRSSSKWYLNKTEKHRCVSSRGCRAEEIQAGMMAFWGEGDVFELHWGLEAGNPNPTWPLTPVWFSCYCSHTWLWLPLLNDCLSCLVCWTLFMHAFCLSLSHILTEPDCVCVFSCLTMNECVCLWAFLLALNGLH